MHHRRAVRELQGVAHRAEDLFGPGRGDALGLGEDLLDGLAHEQLEDEIESRLEIEDLVEGIESLK